MVRTEECLCRERMRCEKMARNQVGKDELSILVRISMAESPCSVKMLFGLCVTRQRKTERSGRGRVRAYFQIVLFKEQYNANIVLEGHDM